MGRAGRIKTGQRQKRAGIGEAFIGVINLGCAGLWPIDGQKQPRLGLWQGALHRLALLPMRHPFAHPNAVIGKMRADPRILRAPVQRVLAPCQNICLALPQLMRQYLIGVSHSAKPFQIGQACVLRQNWAQPVDMVEVVRQMPVLGLHFKK